MTYLSTHNLTQNLLRGRGANKINQNNKKFASRKKIANYCVLLSFSILSRVFPEFPVVVGTLLQA